MHPGDGIRVRNAWCVSIRDSMMAAPDGTVSRAAGRVVRYPGEVMTTLPLSPAYREAIWTAIVLQMFTALFLLTILDGGTLARAGGCAMAGFWIGVAVVMARRPRNPSSLDLLYVRWGYLPMLIVGIGLSPWMEMLRVN